MDDKTMLELAARAAGLDYRHEDGEIRYGDAAMKWNPLVNDGAALRLAVRLGIDIELHGALTPVFKFVCATANNAEIQHEETDENMDIQAATRRAIVRAAADIGKGMGVG